MDTSRAAFLSMVNEVGRRYSALTTNKDKADFRDELDIASATAKHYCAIAKKADAKLALIKKESGQVPIIAESFRTWRTLVYTPDTMIRKAAQAGLFNHEVNSETLARFTGKGLVPTDTPRVKKTIVSKLKRKLEVVESTIRKATSQVSAIRNFMDEHDVTTLSGPEVQRLHRTFKMLCAEIAATDPKMLQRALSTLRGED
jgi:hypothetical protein